MNPVHPKQAHAAKEIHIKMVRKENQLKYAHHSWIKVNCHHFTDVASINSRLTAKTGSTKSQNKFLIKVSVHVQVILNAYISLAKVHAVPHQLLKLHLHLTLSLRVYWNHIHLRDFQSWKINKNKFAFLRQKKKDSVSKIISIVTLLELDYSGNLSVCRIQNAKKVLTLLVTQIWNQNIRKVVVRNLRWQMFLRKEIKSLNKNNP